MGVLCEQAKDSDFPLRVHGKNTSLKEWTNDPLWKNLNAVKNEKAYEVSDAIWNTAGGVIAANQMLDDIERMMSQ